jgi:hypothetical protein
MLWYLYPKGALDGTFSAGFLQMLSVLSLFSANIYASFVVLNKVAIRFIQASTTCGV